LQPVTIVTFRDEPVRGPFKRPPTERKTHRNPSSAVPLFVGVATVSATVSATVDVVTARALAAAVDVVTARALAAVSALPWLAAALTAARTAALFFF
jgi:hypothetical protein